jgi:hypothetical protein
LDNRTPAKKEALMALYCRKCNEELRFFVLMRVHVLKCYGDERKTGAFADSWKQAENSDKTMSELYFQTENPAHAAAQLNRKAKDVIWDALYHDGIRHTVKERLTFMLNNPQQLSAFDYRNFIARMDISGTVEDEKVYYRKISAGEWSATQKSEVGPFAATFSYTNTPNYRYWVSSSRKKVDAFGNENAADAEGVIVRIVFTSSPLAAFKIAAHQQQGVQGNPALVAIHREGFAEIGAVSSATDVQEITGVRPMLDYNLGFTVDQAKALNKMLVSFERL